MKPRPIARFHRYANYKLSLLSFFKGEDVSEFNLSSSPCSSCLNDSSVESNVSNCKARCDWLLVRGVRLAEDDRSRASLSRDIGCTGLVETITRLCAAGARAILLDLATLFFRSGLSRKLFASTKLPINVEKWEDKLDAQEYTLHEKSQDNYGNLISTFAMINILQWSPHF